MPNWRWNAPISEGFREITATNADPDGLVARRLGDLLAELKVSRLAVERQGRILQLRGAEFEPQDIAPPALMGTNEAAGGTDYQLAFLRVLITGVKIPVLCRISSCVVPRRPVVPKPYSCWLAPGQLRPP